jgi:hypothetical protein
MGRSCSKRNTFKILVGTPDGNRPLGRTRRRWKNNIKMGGGVVSTGFM